MTLDYLSLLAQLDRAAYEARVLATFQTACEDYGRRFQAIDTEKVFQVSLFTDPQAGETRISFEVKAHAEQAIRQQCATFRGIGRADLAQQIAQAGYNPSIGDFQYTEFTTVSHPELLAMRSLDYTVHEQWQTADAWIEVSLLRVVELILAQNLLHTLPTEAEVWIGVSSPRDEYDHAHKVGLLR